MAAPGGAAAGIPNNRGPPRRNGRSAEKITEIILSYDAKPTLFNTRRAWTILGYGNSPMPSKANFVRQTNALWNFHSRLQTTSAKKASAYMLDALRTLGFRSPRWHVGLPRLRMTEMDRRENPNRFEDLDGPRLEAGIAGYNEAADMNTRYQTPFLFRRVQARSGSLSYWRGGERQQSRVRRQSGGRIIWNHWEVKGRIWAWFMQSLYDRDAVRWRDYHRLNRLSTTNDPDSGELSLVRALHAGQAQGKPAFCSEEILWVWPTTSVPKSLCLSPTQTPKRMAPKRMAGMAGRSSRAQVRISRAPVRISRAQVRIVSSHRPLPGGNASWTPEQKMTRELSRLIATKIKLHTNTPDWRNFDPVDSDRNPLHASQGYAQPQVPERGPFVWPGSDKASNFQASLDIRGRGFEMPDAATRASWDTYQEADMENAPEPEDWQLRFGRTPPWLNNERRPRRTADMDYGLLDDPYLLYGKDFTDFGLGIGL
ncbi:hypothetical protein B0T26DRAFT_754216 [Lasiosphaeria miniovina]|uniref:Uncharacterized protein n=1 Tax=Lasiosphaeria miniovina TaxID=1954250 RepID=A0AA40AE42_9PEZI|nr:uncharacterized protein B0T26DRAFT_754216 [Lasiosphaeria miniovina]KAK0714191.1 hypothetical protein B0T26DRAFT_754216 [Lasiosphaeria miniovina]